MRNIRLPNTELEVSKLGFGTASLHHLISKRDREKLLTSALDNGFSHFDTARLYGEGLAERTLGDFLQSNRHRVTIATKVGIPANPVLETLPSLMYAQKSISSLTRRLSLSPKGIRKRSLDKKEVENSLQSSLNALRTDWVDIFFIHDPRISEVSQLLKIAEWLQAQKTQGNVRYLGLAGKAKACVEITNQIPGLFDILQVEDSTCDREADIVISSGLPLQITFGYMRKSLENKPNIDPNDAIKSALFRNYSGMILVSSRNSTRLKTLSSFS